MGRLAPLLLLPLVAACGVPDPAECPPITVVPPGEVRVAVGATAERQALDAATGEAATDVSWSAEAPGVIEVVDGTGAVVGAAAGTTRLVAERACGFTATAPVRVIGRIGIEPTQVRLEAGQSLSLSALGADGTVVTGESRWTGTNGTVARVDGGGTVSAVGPGWTTIRAEWQGLTAEVEVEVAEPDGPAEGMAWTVGAWVADQADYRPGLLEDPGVSTLGSCGQATDNHVWLSGEIPATSAPPAEQRFGWATIRTRVLAPDEGQVRDWRSFVIFDPGAPGTLFAPAIEWHTPGYDPESWTGRTVEFTVLPDDPEVAPSAPAVIRIENRMTRENLCCDPGDC